MEKHLNCVREDIEKKELEIESLKKKLEERAKLLDNDDFDTRPSCGKCHQAGHRKNKCAGTKCPASVSCGKLQLHKDEVKSQDLLKASMKKLLKDCSILESEATKIEENIASNTCTFPNAIKSHLINSNKQKYLTRYGAEIVPLSRIINLDTSILQKYYQNKIPDDLECKALNFQHIINIHSSKFKTDETSINLKLMESVRKVDACIKPSDMLTPSMDCSFNSQSTFTPPSTHGCTRPDYIRSIQTSRQTIQAFKPPTRSRLYLDQQQITSAVSSSVEAITSDFSNLNTPPKSYSSINPIHRGIDCSRFSIPFEASQSNSKQNCRQFNNNSKNRDSILLVHRRHLFSNHGKIKMLEAFTQTP